MIKQKPKIALISLYGIENSGIRILTAMLKKHEYDVHTIFFKNWKNNNVKPPIVNEIKILTGLLGKINPDIVGIGFGTPYYKIASNLTEEIRKNIDSIIVWGGIHATIVPEQCIDIADIVCIGEGEYPIVELADSIYSGKPYSKISNLWVRTKNEIYKNPPRELNQNLDSLPLKDFENSNKYFIEDNKIVLGDPILNIVELRVNASRGCPFQCSYCYNNVLKTIYSAKGNYYRTRSVNNVIDEIKYALSSFKKISRVKFDDDTFISDINWIDEFCAEYLKEVNIPFDIMLNPQLININVLKKLKKAGLKRVQIGIESISDNVNKNLYQRYMPNSHIIEFMENNKTLKIDVVFDIILDNPMTSENDKKALFEFLMKLPRPFKLFLYSLVYFPKTQITEEFLKNGLITPDDVEGFATKSFKQFRLSFDYPRSKEDIFYISLLVLITKPFVPKWAIYLAYRSKYLRNNPLPLKILSQICNFIMMSMIGIGMFLRGELSFTKIKEYASIKKMITQ